MNFDMKRIGKNIASLRRDHNMTQMQLADEVGVSFQAVSNWERGNSMPDISKLPQLSELFSVSIDELLGDSSPLVEKAAEGKLEEHLKTLEENGIYITVQEAAEVGPILLPEQMDIVIDQVMHRSDLDELDEDDDDEDEGDHDDDDEEDFDDLDDEDEDDNASREKPFRLRDLLPFMSTEKVDQLLRQKVQARESLRDFLPFASEGAIDELAKARLEAGESIDELRAFISGELMDELTLRFESQGKSIRKLCAFVSEETIDQIIVLRIKNKRSVKELLPFASERLLDKLADTIAE